jgi:glutamate formiminotransferase
VNHIEVGPFTQARSVDVESVEATGQRMLSVPNVSEGRRGDILATVTDACRSDGADVIDIHTDADHNRSVLSIVARPDALILALQSLARACVATIDVRRHEGVHPCTGALDVVPIVLFDDAALPIATQIADDVAGYIGEYLDVPVFLYGQLARTEQLRRPHGVRSIGVDQLADEMRDGTRTPDYGPARMHPTAGCVLVGVRPPLVAWNVWLPDATRMEARALADRVRESGGGLPGVRAMGLYLPEAGMMQLSMNLEDTWETPVGVVMRVVRREAERLGIALGDSELVGMIPRHALGRESPESLGLVGFSHDRILEHRCPDLHRDYTQGAFDR